MVGIKLQTKLKFNLPCVLSYPMIRFQVDSVQGIDIKFL